MSDKAGASNFYRNTMKGAKRKLLNDAATIEGLDHEIAFLRTQLYLLAQEEPVRFPLIVEGMNTLVRLQITRQKLAKSEPVVLGDQVIDLLRSFGYTIAPDVSDP